MSESVTLSKAATLLSQQAGHELRTGDVARAAERLGISTPVKPLVVMKRQHVRTVDVIFLDEILSEVLRSKQ